MCQLRTVTCELTMTSWLKGGKVVWHTVVFRASTSSDIQTGPQALGTTADLSVRVIELGTALSPMCLFATGSSKP